ncbi:putative 2-aminoethylphosphonate ABC transporter permease subunit [Xanthobacter sp. V3C-3]|uniref:putative 2-aminoethylphosphonate ABC transporter permease subunit n=1 Tax=Xanthobacter lutulentifluminis TaxID=3119935 RepID=UPI00372969E1
MSDAALSPGAALPAAPAIRPKSGRDDRLMLVFTLVIGLYLVVSLALPILFMLWKSTEVRAFSYGAIEMQVDTGAGPVAVGTLADVAERFGLQSGVDQARRSNSLTAAQLFPKRTFDGAPLKSVRFRFAGGAGAGSLDYAGAAVAPGQWVDVAPQDLRRLVVRAGTERSLDNYIAYFRNPALTQSIANSLMVSLITTAITVLLAFGFAYALNRTCMPLKGLFRTIAMVPILVPSLLAGLSLVYLFGNQGLLKDLLMGGRIYGAPGIVAGCVFFTFPHAFLIIATALAVSDARLYEAARVLRTPPRRTFLTVTLPGARYGLISAAFVVFTLTITEFGVPKVVGGDFNVLAVDIYKQVVGQQNFAMGAVVSVILLVPAVVAFFVDRMVTARQVAQLTARAVPYAPKPDRRLDMAAFAFCCVVAGLLLLVLGVSQYAALVRFWPYDLSLSFTHFAFEGVDGGGWGSYFNSLRLAFYTAVIGTAVVFVGAYIVEKGRGFLAARSGLHFLAMLPMAIPGLVLGLDYIFFFNDKANPLNVIYGSMAILVISTVTHFYTVSHLTALTALKAMDREFEAVAASLKQPVTRMFTRVTLPVCLPTGLDIAAYYFVNAMTTVSAVVFLYSPSTTLAAVASLNMDDAGQIQAAAAMCMLIFYTNLVARGVHAVLSRGLARTQEWRTR